MNFKDQLAKDLSVFINPNEFGSLENIEGKQISVVIDNDALKELKLKNDGEGLANSELLFHVVKTEWDQQLGEPFVERDIMFNKGFYRISDVQDSDGLYTITLEAPQG